MDNVNNNQWFLNQIIVGNTYAISLPNITDKVIVVDKSHDSKAGLETLVRVKLPDSYMVAEKTVSAMWLIPPNHPPIDKSLLHIGYEYLESIKINDEVHGYLNNSWVGGKVVSYLYDKNSPSGMYFVLKPPFGDYIHTPIIRNTQ